MALPLIPVLGWIGAGAVAAFGAKKGYDAYQDTKSAGEYHEAAKDMYEASENYLNERKQEAEKLFNKLGKVKALVNEGNLTRYIELVKKLEIECPKDLSEIIKDFDLSKLQTMRQEIIDLNTAIGSIAGGAASGALAGIGAFGAVSALGTASTGAAIGSLGGVAATNATLAWLGGGSLATGGLGVAGGTALLGGIVAAPVIAVAGLVWAKSAESKKYDAMSYYSAVSVVCEHLKAEELLWVQIADRAKETERTLIKINEDLGKAVDIVEEIAIKKGFTNVGTRWNDDEKKSIEAMSQLAVLAHEIIKSPLLFDDDKTTQDIIKQQKKVKELMDEIQSKFGDK